MCQTLLAGLTLWSAQVLAGMPVIVVNEVPKLRMQAISFFLLAFFGCALGVKLIWNYLQRDFSALPRISYLKAVGLTLLLGLLFMTVLTMISGARELMTPGAWQKKGATYELKDDIRETRRMLVETQLRSLARILDRYELQNGAFPPHEFVPEIPESEWSAGASGGRFIYLAGRKRDLLEPRVLAFAPGHPDEERAVLLTNMQMVTLHPVEIRRRLDREDE